MAEWPVIKRLLIIFAIPILYLALALMASYLPNDFLMSFSGTANPWRNAALGTLVVPQAVFCIGIISVGIFKAFQWALSAGKEAKKNG